MTAKYKDDITEYKKEFQKIKEYYDLDDNDIYYIDSIAKDKKQLNNNNSHNIYIIYYKIIIKK